MSPTHPDNPTGFGFTSSFSLTSFLAPLSGQGRAPLIAGCCCTFLSVGLSVGLSVSPLFLVYSTTASTVESVESIFHVYLNALRQSADATTP